MAEIPGVEDAEHKELATFLREFNLECLKSKFVKSEIHRPLDLLCHIIAEETVDGEEENDDDTSIDKTHKEGWTPGMTFEDFCSLHDIDVVHKLNLKLAVTKYVRRRTRLQTECQIKQQTHSNLRARHILSDEYVRSRYKPEQLTLFSIGILGHTYAGKTSMLERLKMNRFDEAGEMTLGIDLTSLYVAIDPTAEEYPVAHLSIWDTAGAERFRHCLSDQYYRGKDAFIFVYDVCDERSFERVQEWHNDLEERVDKEEVVRVLVGNKTDLLFDQTKFTTGDADEIRTRAASLASRLGMTLFEVSSKTGQNMVSMIVETVKQIFEFQKIKKYIVPPTKFRSFTLDGSIFGPRKITDPGSGPTKIKGCCI